MKSAAQYFNEGVDYAMPLFIKDFGLMPFQAAGILGNFARESGLIPGRQEIKPNALSGRGGLGWAQWTNERRMHFENYCLVAKRSTTDIVANYGFAWIEFNGDYHNVILLLKKATTIEEATDIVERHYEIAGVVALQERVAFAKKALARYQAKKDEPMQDAATVVPPTIAVATNKPWWQSKTIISGAVTVILAAVGMVIPAATHIHPDVVTTLLIDGATLVSGLISIVGRFGATQPIGKPGSVSTITAGALTSQIAALNTVLRDLKPIAEQAGASGLSAGVSEIQNAIGEASPVIDMLTGQTNMIADIHTMLSKLFGTSGFAPK